MGQVFIPTTLAGDVQVGEMIDEMMAEAPECKDDYFLVDDFGDEINIKAFDGVGVDAYCKAHGITPRDYCMEMMRQQNENKGV